jgi:hypothetical protein
VYATHVLEEAIGRRLDRPDVSYRAMQIVVIVGMCMYEQALLQLYRNSHSVA